MALTDSATHIGELIQHIPLSVYGICIAVYLGMKFLGAIRYDTPTGSNVIADGGDTDSCPTVSVIIPEYNERPDLMGQCLDSVLAQTYEVSEIFVTDDGSDDTRAWEVAQDYATNYDLIDVERLEQNQGKRHAQARGFEAASGDIYVTVDSDTVLEKDAIEQLIDVFGDPNVMAATGYPQVINNDSTLLTRLIRMRYWIAFNIDRAARSTLGLVMCCCGVFSAYRASVVDESLDKYTNQTFLGKECTFGDDRRLTAYALQRGKVVYHKQARSHTRVPESLSRYIKQQVRWMRSFWRESLLALRWSPSRSYALTGLVLAEMSLPVALFTFGLGSVLYGSILLGATASLIGYIGVISLMAYARNIFFSRVKLRTYLMSPVYGFLYFSMLLPLSFYALATMHVNHWGTR